MMWTMVLVEDVIVTLLIDARVQAVHMAFEEHCVIRDRIVPADPTNVVS
jgi:hypothetical protein